MAGQTILIIRHAEKPEPKGAAGVDANCVLAKRSLTPRGWQRAGAWTLLFAPALGQATALPTPTAIFASAPASRVDIDAGGGGSKSRRPLETVTPLAAKLGMNVHLDFARGDEPKLAAALSTMAGVTLACWQHEDIVAISKALAPQARGIPATWPGDRFNVVFRFERPDAASAWAFKQVVPVMLDGDSAAPI